MGAPHVDETELPRALLKAGNNLLKPHSSTKALLDLLNEAETQLSFVEQDPILAVENALRPSMRALVSADLLRNCDSDVRVYVVSCLTEIMRITAPEAPYNDGKMKEIFRVTVEAFGKLADSSCPSYKKAVAVLDTVSRVRSSLVMLDLECDDLILNMFRQFLKTIRPNHPEPVLLSMETIMVTVIDESEKVSMDLLKVLLDTVKRESQDVSPMSSWLVEKVLISCACKLQPCIMEALESTGTIADIYSPVVLAICQGEAEAYIVVKPKQIDADEKISDEQVPSDSLQGKLDLWLSRKGNRSTRIARSGTRASGDDKVRDGNDLKQLLKQLQSESTDAETEAGSTRRRGRKLNSLINSEKKNSRAMYPSTKESEHTSKSHPKRKRTAREETESHKSELGQELVGKRVKVWWPLDAKFYEGIVKSYCSRKKKHQVSYSDGEVENLNLKKEHWEIIQDNFTTSEEEENDMPDSTHLYINVMPRQKAKKSKNVSMNVELRNSSNVRSSKKKDVSNEPESREEQNPKSSEKQNAETGRTEKEQKGTPATHRESEKDCDDKEEPETKDEGSLKFGKESNAEPECKRDLQELRDDSNAEAKTDGEVRVAVKEPNEEPETEVQEREPAKEPTADTKLIEKEDMSEEKESNRDGYTSVRVK